MHDFRKAIRNTTSSYGIKAYDERQTVVLQSWYRDRIGTAEKGSRRWISNPHLKACEEGHTRLEPSSVHNNRSNRLADRCRFAHFQAKLTASKSALNRILNVKDWILTAQFDGRSNKIRTFLKPSSTSAIPNVQSTGRKRSTTQRRKHWALRMRIALSSLGWPGNLFFDSQMG
jgi:hypothetical protein